MQKDKVIVKKAEYWSVRDELTYIWSGRDVIVLNKWQTDVWKSIDGSQNCIQICESLVCDELKQEEIYTVIEGLINYGLAEYDEEDDW